MAFDWIAFMVHRARVLLLGAACLVGLAQSPWAAGLPEPEPAPATQPTAPTGAQLAQADALGKDLYAQANALTKGLDFSPDICGQAMPLLANAAKAWEAMPSLWRDGELQLQWAQCEISIGQHAAAATRLEALAGRLGRGTHADQQVLARLRLPLADLHAQGLGVPQDRERALGLYLLAMGWSPQQTRHLERSAADLVVQLGGPRELFHHLLERSDVASNWLRSLEARKADRGDSLDLMLRRVKAIGIANPYLADDPQEQQALATLKEIAGQQLLVAQRQRDSSLLPAAMVLLQQSGTPKALAEFSNLDAAMPYQLVMPDGTHWKPTHAPH